MNDPYRVQPGDTLSSISQQCGTSVHDLMRFNGIRHANKIQAGEVLYLSAASAFGVSAVFLDTLRHPVANLAYKISFDGQTLMGTTGATGTMPRKVTRDAQSEFRIWVRNAEAQWEQVVSTVSGYGHKLITLVSPWLVFKGKTEALPHGAPALPVTPPAPPSPAPSAAQKPLPPPVTGTPTKNNPHVHTKTTKGPQGQSIIQLSVDIPQGLLDFFAGYTGEEISEGDWKKESDALTCEKEVLKAIAKVESGGSAFWRLNSGQGAVIPALLYERHYFSRLTKRKYDQDHPDISWPSGYLRHNRKHHVGKEDAAEKDGVEHTYDFYEDHANSYLRLVNAYRLDKDAALQSCSWSKFQIMGANYKACESPDIDNFVATMCKSEAGQIKLLGGFIRRKPRVWKNARHHELGKEISLLEAVQTKNWRAIAFNYNGSDYEKNKYHILLEKYYTQYKNGQA